MKDKIIVLGDSHVRTFAKTNVFYPFFLGPGRAMNYVSDTHRNDTQNKIQHVMSHFDRDDVFIFVFGEPDCRWWTGHGWNPWLKDFYKDNCVLKPTNIGVNFQELDNSIKRYQNTINDIKELGYENVIIYNATASENNKQNNQIYIWNSSMKNFCDKNEIPFIDLSDNILVDKKINPEFVADVVHLNDKPAKLVFNILVDKELISSEVKLSSEPYDYLEIKQLFIINPKFNCLTFPGGYDYINP